jgi:hypothetical protein
MPSKNLIKNIKKNIYEKVKKNYIKITDGII